jgi:hypothetical protein
VPASPKEDYQKEVGIDRRLIPSKRWESDVTRERIRQIEVKAIRKLNIRQEAKWLRNSSKILT